MLFYYNVLLKDHIGTFSMLHLWKLAHARTSCITRGGLYVGFKALGMLWINSTSPALRELRLTEQQLGEVGCLYVVVVNHWCRRCYKPHERWHVEMKMVSSHHPTLWGKRLEVKKHSDFIRLEDSGLVCELSLVGHDALCKLADVDKQQWEGEDPSHVVPREMKPCVMMDLDFGALTSPACDADRDREKRRWRWSWAFFG